MRVAVLSVTENGGALGAAMAQALAVRHETDRYAYARYAGEGQTPFETIDGLMRERFQTYDAWIFISAAGIAVRAIAPYIVSKRTDPAVVVIDEGARFAIPVLSGHIGGGNALARRLGEITGAQPVITTATDALGRLSPDVFAAANDLIITDFGAAKEVASAVLAGESVAVMSEYPVTHLPPECVQTAAAGTCRTGICIGADPTHRPFPVTLHLVPRNLVLGIGCRRGVPAERITSHVDASLKTVCPEGMDEAAWIRLMHQRITAVASIDRKADEEGLAAYCEALGITPVFYSAEDLAAVPDPGAMSGSAAGEGAFSSSAFVEETVGVDNVCERSAVLCSGGRLILPKTAGGGVTVAAAEIPLTLDAEKEMRW